MHFHKGWIRHCIYFTEVCQREAKILTTYIFGLFLTKYDFKFQVLEKIGEFLALKLVSGQYAYSMEATCHNGKEQLSPNILVKRKEKIPLNDTK